MTEPRKVNINGTEYNWDDLSEDVRAQLVNLRITDGEIERLNRQLSIAKTAKNAYGRALRQAMEASTEK